MQLPLVSSSAPLSMMGASAAPSFQGRRGPQGGCALHLPLTTRHGKGESGIVSGDLRENQLVALAALILFDDEIAEARGTLEGGRNPLRELLIAVDVRQTGDVHAEGLGEARQALHEH